MLKYFELMKKFLFIFISLFLIHANAQKEANNWFFGQNAGLSFESGSPVAVSGGQLNTEEGCTSISNSSGDLLFYTNGVYVYNKNDLQMPNGYGLLGDQSSTQSAIIVPKPGDPDIYYIFTVMDQNGSGEGLQYSAVNMSLDGGLGDIVSTEKNVQILSNTAEKVTAVRSESGDAVLVITFKDNSFYVYEITASGVDSNAISVSSGNLSVYDNRGYLKSSPDATKIAIAHQGDGQFVLYDFDSTSGSISNPLVLPLIAPNDKPYGVEFSANSELLYVLASNDNGLDSDPNSHTASIYQFDLSLSTPSDIIASRTVIDERNQYRGALQLGPDFKIYRSQSDTYDTGSPYLGVIQNPEISGLGCNYEHDAVDLGGNLSRQGLPPFIQSFFASQILHQGDCSGDIISFSLSNTDGVLDVIWDFGDGTPTVQGDLTPTHVYVNSGNYIVTVEVTTIDETVTLAKEVTIFETPIINSPVALKQCDDDLDGFSPFNLTEANAEISTNFANETFTYFETFVGADINDSNELIPNPLTYTNQTVTVDTVFARVESNAKCHSVAQVDLTVSTTQIPSSFQKVFYECDDYLNANNDDTDGISSFDFSSVTAEVEDIFLATGQELTISYYRNENDALAELNPIVDIADYRNIGYPNTQIIFIRVDTELNNDCLGLGPHITLFVEPVPVANPVFIDRECDDNNDGLFPFDTSQVEPTVLNGQTGMIVSYTDQSGNTLPSPLPNPFLTGSQQITIKVTDESTQDPDGFCYDETILSLIVDQVPIAYPVADIEACDDDFDGQLSFDTSLIETELLEGQTGMSISYTDQLGNALPSPLPNPFLSESQTISVEIENSQNSDCSTSTTIDFIVNPKPEFYLDEAAILCLNDPPLILNISDATGIFTYEWTDENNEVVSNSDNVEIYSGGVYSVIATTTDGTECVSNVHSIFVTESINPTILEESIVIVDDSDNNSITIDLENLGIGDYEFSIDDISGPYQDEPYFDNLLPGIYTIYVRDKNGCGFAEIDVPIIGFPDFFTPNDDTYNDTWLVVGVDSDYYNAVEITIFDRFGKILTILDMNSNNYGWDGSYDGKIMPTSDYWFSATLVDKKDKTRIRKGHFSLLR